MKNCFKAKLFLLLLFVCILFCSCGKKSASTDSSKNSVDINTPSTEKGTWDNTPKVLVPSADGTESYSCDSAIIDVSHMDEGYIMVSYTGTNPKVKLQITGPDSVTYTYDLHGGYETFPLTSGSGAYNISVFENIEGTQYATAITQDINADITNEFGPYLYPNQYVNFTDAPLTIQKGSDLAYYCSSDIEVVQSVYNYIIENFKYDYDKADSVKSGYLPDVDSVFSSNTGICFDYASVMATMLRTQSIPTRLEVGYKGEEYHAWISTYIKNVGWINGIIEFDGSSWNLLDPTYASTSSSPENFISKKSDYITKYVY